MTMTPEETTKSAHIAGTLYCLVAIGIVMSTISNEALYPRTYTTFANTISDLSGTEPPHSIVLEPSRSIFVVTMLLSGLALLVGTWFLARVVDRRRFVVAMTAFGIGLVGIGIFPGDVEGFHPLFAICCFVGGSVAAVMSRKVIDGPLRHFAWVLGGIALVATVLGLESFADFGPQAELGRGGIERWIAYPVLLWLMAYGARLLSGRRSEPSAAAPLAVAGTSDEGGRASPD
jgi:hypothetical membrane protein